jgi:HSP20 family protein
MHTIVHTTSSETPRTPGESASVADFRKPHYDCRGRQGAMQLVVYIPGVDAAGVMIEARGPDLTITARKTRFVRVNWQALNLEGAQHDYRLKLRLGKGYAFHAMEAEMHNGVLTITLPKAHGDATPAAGLKRFA